MPVNAPSTSRYLEVERKFDVDESTQPPSLTGIAEIGRVERAETQALDAVYFDTAARDLAIQTNHVAPPHRRGRCRLASEAAGGPGCPHRSAGAFECHERRR